MYLLNRDRVSVLGHHGHWPNVAQDVFIADGVCLIGEVEIGSGCSVWFNCVLRGDVNFIRIGKDCNIQDGSVIHVENGAYSCILEDRVSVGHSVTLHGCYVEEDCLIGMGATILNHARIGKGSIVGAGALVPEGMNIPPGSLVVGVPARNIRTVKDGEIQRVKSTATRYKTWSQDYREMGFQEEVATFRQRFEASKG